MHPEINILSNPGLVIALALALGMVAQAVAHHLRLPGIVLLLATGVALGPDGFNLVRPDAVGSGLTLLTGFAVAVILFEGGLNLKFEALRHTQAVIRRLLLSGSVLTVACGALAVHYILGWSWEISILFGTLAMVTGPTVINPLLRRLRVRHNVATVLEAEGVLIDAIGAVVAMVALEAVLSTGHGSLLSWAGLVVTRLGFGMLIGTAAAFLLVLLYRVKRLIPEGTENVFTLAAVLVLFQGSNAIMPESGIAAVIAAGIVVGNFGSRALNRLAEFKEELTVMLIGLLFILLAADVRISQVNDLGFAGLAVVLLLMFIIRPAAVFLATWKSKLSFKEQLFIAWIGPRGIVAAAIASFFAASFAERGLGGGLELRALVFLLIAGSVIFAGLTGGPLASLLGLRRPRHEGWVILSANPLARSIASLMCRDGQEVICIDSNPENCAAVTDNCTKAIHGNGLQGEVLDQTEIETRRGAIALTANDEVNFLFINRITDETGDIGLYLAQVEGSTSLTDSMVQETESETLFGRPVDIEYWNHLIAENRTVTQLWERNNSRQDGNPEQSVLSKAFTGRMLAVALRRNSRLLPVGSKLKIKPRDQLYLLINGIQAEGVGNELRELGWQRLDDSDGG